MNNTFVGDNGVTQIVLGINEDLPSYVDVVGLDGTKTMRGVQVVKAAGVDIPNPPIKVDDVLSMQVVEPEMVRELHSISAAQCTGKCSRHAPDPECLKHTMSARMTYEVDDAFEEGRDYDG